MTLEIDEGYMRQALELAETAAEEGEVPVGALLVRDDKVIGCGSNAPIGRCDPTAHAEIRALREAAEAEANYRLPYTTLYVTIEPCTMCLGALVHARVQRIVFGALEPKAGVIESHPEFLTYGHFNHRFECVGGVLADECAALISDFFAERRRLKAELKKPFKC